MKYRSLKTILALTLVFVLVGSFPMEIMAMASDVVVIESQPQNIIDETLPKVIKPGTSNDGIDAGTDNNNVDKDNPEVIVEPEIKVLPSASPIAPVALGLSDLDSNPVGTLLTSDTEWILDNGFSIEVDGIYYLSSNGRPAFDSMENLSIKFDPNIGGGNYTDGLYISVYDEDREKLHYNYTDVTDLSTRYPYGGALTVLVKQSCNRKTDLN